MGASGALSDPRVRRERVSSPSRVWRELGVERPRRGETIGGIAASRRPQRALARASRWLGCGLVSAAVAIGSGPAPAQEEVTIAILPIVVHSAESPDYVREGLADMLTSRFEQVQRFQVIQVEDRAKATTRLSLALEAARTVGADFVLFGSFTRFGQGASLDMQCAATAETAQGNPLREIFVLSGSIGDVIPDLDELVGKVSRFAIADFEDSTAVSADSNQGSAANRRLVEDLRKRVESLESSVARLTRELKELRSKPEEE